MRRTTTSVTATSFRLFGGLIVGMLALSACATPVGGAMTPSPTPTATLESPTPEPTPEESATPDMPAPTETVEVDTPYNGEVLIITAEQRGATLEVTAMVPGVSEDDGTCTLRVDGVGVATITSTAGNGVTYCGLMSADVASDSAATRFDVQYESSSTRARSADSSVESSQ
ncbi:hypothetical protein PUW79_10770 [Microbacterium sp. NE2HP2]|uniref:hypothetical protein n=1 Tax=Microbacterium plantarum TaxID=1816425 RepID=UPI002366E0D1|nr:hypothetical protein [Microbacterium plantarum]MDD7945112.1 hypothetical protein [Microbacterium plantarum]